MKLPNRITLYLGGKGKKYNAQQVTKPIPNLGFSLNERIFQILKLVVN